MSDPPCMPNVLPHTRLYADAAVFLPHAIRNAIFPVQLRLDALLRSPDADDHVRRAQESVTHLMWTVEGFALLLEPREHAYDPRADDWTRPLHALCSALSASAELRIIDELASEQLPALPIPRATVARLIATLLLTLHQHDAHARAAIVVTGATDMVHLVTDVTLRSPAHTQEVADRLCAECLQLLDPSDSLTHAVHSNGVEVHVRLARRSATDAVLANAADIAKSFRVLCIDDNVSLIDALESRLLQVRGFAGLTRANSAATAASALRAQAVDLVLLDVHLSDGEDPVAAISALRSIAPSAHIALFSGTVNDDLIRRCMDAGASGFLLKGVTPVRLIDAIVRLARGETLVLLDD